MKDKYFTTFPIIQKHITKAHKISRAIVILGVLSLFIAFVFCKPHTLIYQFLISFWFACLLIAFFIVSFVKKYNIIGKLILHDEMIAIEISNEKKIFHLNEINDLIIKYGGYEGESYKSFVILTMSTRSGRLNLIKFDYQGTNYKYEFFLQSKPPLIMTLSCWEKNGVHFQIVNEYDKKIEL